jgi:alpha-ketoglutarate-dependent taurine dioxygenase
VNISLLTRTPSGDFAGIVTGIDLTQPLTSEQISAIEAGMDRYAVLVFRDQPLTDEQQCAYSRNFGELEATLIAQMSKPGERRLGPVELGDISNLDPDGKLRDREDSRRMRQPVDYTSDDCEDYDASQDEQRPATPRFVVSVALRSASAGGTPLEQRAA